MFLLSRQCFIQFNVSFNFKYALKIDRSLERKSNGAIQKNAIIIGLDACAPSQRSITCDMKMTLSLCAVHKNSAIAQIDLDVEVDKRCFEDFFLDSSLKTFQSY